MSYPPASPSATLVNAVGHNERPSVMYRFPHGKSNILNSVVVDAAGHSLYTISSNSRRTTLVACRNNVEVATVQWDRSSPRMVFRGKKIKCKEWLPLAGLGTEYSKPPPLIACHTKSGRDLARARLFTHGDSQFVWMQRSSSSSGYVRFCYH